MAPPGSFVSIMCRHLTAISYFRDGVVDSLQCNLSKRLLTSVVIILSSLIHKVSMTVWDHLPTWKVKNGHMNKGKMAGYIFPSHGSNGELWNYTVFFSGGHFFIVESVLNPQNSPLKVWWMNQPLMNRFGGGSLDLVVFGGVVIFVKKTLLP